MTYDPQPFMGRAEAAADKGTDEYKLFFGALDNYHKRILKAGGHHDGYKDIAEKADEET